MNKTIVKTLMPLFLAIVMAAAFVPVLSDDSDATTGEYTENNMTYTYNTDTLTATLKTYGGTSAASVTIPSSITVSGAGVFVVNAIGKDVFMGHTEITSITIPATVTSIGSQAFRNISATEITIPDSVTSISSAAFQYNTALKTITFGSGVTSLPDNVLRGCTALETVTLGKNVASIGNGALYGCSSLKTINIAEGNTSFVTDGNGVLYSADKTVLYNVPADYSGTFTVPDTVTKIFAGAFKGCSEIVRLELTGSQNYDVSDLTSLTSVKLGKGSDVDSCCLIRSTTLTSVEIEDGGKYVSVDGVVFTADKTTLVYNPSARTGTYAIPEGTAVIGANAMANSQYSSVAFPDTVIQIEYYAFELSAIESLDLSGSGMVIGEGAFSGCCAKSVKLGNHSYVFGDGAFYDCSDVKTVYNGSSLPLTAGSEDYGFIAAYATEVIDTADKTVTVKCGDEVLWTQKVSYGSDVTVPEIENYQLSSASLTNVTADTEITATCLYVFTYDDTNMTASVARNTEANATSYDIPSTVVHDGKTYTVTAIDAHGFYDCTSLTSVTFPDTLTTINPNSFMGCSNLTSVVLPQSLTFLGSGAFKATGITSVTVPDSVDSVSAFGGSSLIDVFVSSSNPNLCSVDGVVFSKDKTELLLYPAGKTQTAYAIPEGTVTVSSDTFQDCTALTSVTLPSTLTKIGIPAFYGCTNLATVYNASDIALVAGQFCGTGSFVASYATQVIDIRDKTVTVKCGDDVLWTETFAYGSDVEIPEIEGYLLSKTSISAIAADETVTATYLYIFTYDDTNLTASVARNTEANATSYDIPSTVTYNGKTYTVTSIADNGFKNCTSMTSVTIPDSVTYLGNFAFESCTALTSVTIPDSVTKIDQQAFAYCNALTSVTIPDSVTELGLCPFRKCTSLTDIFVGGGNTACCSVDGVLFSKDRTTLIQYPAGKTQTAYAIPEGTVTVGCAAFGGDNLTTVTIPSTLTGTGTWAFGDCDKIGTIYNASDLKITPFSYDWGNLAENASDINDISDKTVTVKCGDEVLWTETFAHGSDVEIPEIEGYTLSKTSITAIAADETVEATKIVCKVDVKCGENVLKTYTAEYGFDVAIDAIEGYTLSKTAITGIKADETVTATLNTYTVKVVSGDWILATYTADYGEDVTIDAIEGYTLSKTSVTAIKADETVTATKITYTVTVKNGENVLKTYDADYGTNVIIDEIEGYTLSKTSITAIAADETVDAEANVYIVSVVCEGVTLSSARVGYGETVNLDEIEGFTLAKTVVENVTADTVVDAERISVKVTVKCGETVLREIDAYYWDDVTIDPIEGYELAKTSITAIKADETVEATKIVCKVDVKCGENVLKTYTAEYGEDVTIDAIEGYTLPKTAITGIRADETVTATLNTYTVTVTYNGWILATYTAEYGEDVTIDAIEGYNLSKTSITAIAADETVTATKIVCKVTVKCGETVLDEIDAEYGTNVIIDAIEGYDLSKTSITAIKADETVTAEKSVFTVKVVCGTEILATYAVAYGDNVTIGAIEGYEIAKTLVESVEANETVTATKIVYTVKVVCGETVLRTITAEYGTNVIIDEIEGYTLSKTSIPAIKADETVTAEKTAVETGDVTVSVVCGDKAIWTQAVKSGSDVTVPALEGYEFSEVTLVSVGSDTVLSAKQIICTVKVVCGEEVLATYSVPYGETVNLDEIEGFTLAKTVVENVTADTVVTAVVAEASGEDGEETEEKTEDDGTDTARLIAVAVCVVLGCLCLVGTYFLGDPRMFAGALILYAAAFAVWKFL